VVIFLYNTLQIAYLTRTADRFSVSLYIFDIVLKKYISEAK